MGKPRKKIVIDQAPMNKFEPEDMLESLVGCEILLADKEEHGQNPASVTHSGWIVLTENIIIALRTKNKKAAADYWGEKLFGKKYVEFSKDICSLVE